MKILKKLKKNYSNYKINKIIIKKKKEVVVN